MAKTYTAVGTVAAGDVYTASAYNAGVAVNLSNLIVPPAVKVQLNSIQTITDATYTFVSFDTEIFDTDAMFAPASTTITIATAGIYIVTANVRHAAGAGGSMRMAAIALNSSTASDTTKWIATQAIRDNAVLSVVSLSTTFSASVADTIKIVAYQNYGGSGNIGSTTIPDTNCSLTWIGRTA